jgi:cytochrome c oxidase cbb3-type subunit 4
MGYGPLRHFADSWGLLLMVLAFAVVLVWVFRPGGKKAQDEAARQIFRNEDRPKQDAPKKDDKDGH